ncbi:MAG: enoyl-CoA hydratase/isomerase family protein [Phycisphaerales bacterium]
MAADLLPVHVDETGPAAGVTTLFLEQEGKPVVVLNRAFLEKLDRTLDAVGQPDKGFVLASNAPRAFVAGADLGEIDSLNDQELDEYLQLGSRVYGRIAAFACHTVAAINGATLGGGLELAMHCDTLVAAMPKGTPEKPARPYPIGLPECGLAICPGWGGTNMLPARMDAAKAILATAKGHPMTVVEAREAGLVSQLLDSPDGLLDLAKERAAKGVGNPHKGHKDHEPLNISMDAHREDVRAAMTRVMNDLPDTQAASAVAACVEAGLSGGWTTALECERENLIRLRHTPEAREAIEAFFAKTKA